MRRAFTTNGLARLLAMGLFGVTGLMQAAQAQVATIEDIQSAPLKIEAPYRTFETSQPAVVLLQVNEPASISASSPFPNGFEDPSGTHYSSLLRHNGREVSQDTPLSLNTLGETQVELEMQVVRPRPYPANSYSYSVLLTITVQ